MSQISEIVFPLVIGGTLAFAGYMVYTKLGFGEEPVHKYPAIVRKMPDKSKMVHPETKKDPVHEPASAKGPLRPVPQKKAPMRNNVNPGLIVPFTNQTSIDAGDHSQRPLEAVTHVIPIRTLHKGKERKHPITVIGSKRMYRI